MLQDAKNGTNVLSALRTYVRLVASEPEVLRLIGDESIRKGTDKLTSVQIARAISEARRAAKR